ncbi:sugar ABC transporter ATP-binding protein [Kibdelosporangium phytohabitans]|uniref:Multidrug ABC transporter ATP-binding protein n=1 Tax=Kibdelosporangium phytohabitans TaxID=860235 RepID=A0A0N9I9X3_9PSEU|nr:sugar ABC transporter ATP-binding protein [Kibdelosporangium phytohabitans]ALG11472.1 multidrug ABC transporter ATP-binding protein [Kibdelosporangium phytohabitans]MBE1462819.1 simple sugar transport system ATP-binding protein [Kibdelosporangium phytohabitans]
MSAVNQPAASGQFAAVARGVTKRYGRTVALDDVGIEIRDGESHALVGRNGAGKSTLVSILTGLQAADSGEVSFFGNPAPALSDREGWRRNVACVYQRSTIMPALSVAENLFINRQGKRMISWPKLRKQASELLEPFGVAVDVTTPASELTVEQRQLVEIARALSVGARFIILDEPTAQLDGPAIERLFERLRALQDTGITFMFISHHLEEIYEVCQTVTVFRDARHILTAPVAELGRAELVDAMTGEPGGLSVPGAADRPDVSQDTGVALNVRNLTGDSFSDVSLSIRKGEVIGLAGSASSGKHQLAETVYGLRKASSGVIEVDGRKVRPGSVLDALRHGIGCVPRDRHHQGLVLGLSIAENAAMTVMNKLGPAGLVAPKRLAGVGSNAIESYDIVTSGADQPVSDLSGGNQQKVVMARALASDPRVLVLINPTAGVDVKSKESLLGVVDRVARAGTAVIVVSDELDDLRVCDRVLVMFHGEVAHEFGRDWTEQDLVAAIEGVSEK